MFFGISFSDYHSLVAAAWKDEKGYVKAVPLTDIGRGEPTLILYDREKKRTVFGDECRRGYGLMHPEDVIRNLKGMVRKAGGLDFEVQSGGVAFSGEDLLSMYIGHLLDDARAKAMKYSIDGTTAIEGVTVTVPVAIHKDNISSTRYREVLKKVVSQKMGVTEDSVTVISEPIAAAVSYMASGSIEGGDRIRLVVFDMGGGTTDVALVDFDPIHLEGDVIKTGGDPGLGGNDWDEALKRLVLAKAEANQKGKKGVNPDDPAFNKDITDLKEGLSTREKEYIKVGNEIYTVTRREFEDATAGLLEKALGCMGDIVDKSADRKIDAIILTGGSCNMPQVQKGISEKYPHLADRVMTISPSHAIAQGAARYALSLTSRNIWSMVISEVYS